MYGRTSIHHARTRALLTNSPTVGKIHYHHDYHYASDTRNCKNVHTNSLRLLATEVSIVDYIKLM